jgi:hypothetical protein
MVRAEFATTFNWDVQLPQIAILKVANDSQIETNLTFIRSQ